MPGNTEMLDALMSPNTSSTKSEPAKKMTDSIDAVGDYADRQGVKYGFDEYDVLVAADQMNQFGLWPENKALVSAAESVNSYGKSMFVSSGANGQEWWRAITDALARVCERQGRELPDYLSDNSEGPVRGELEPIEISKTSNGLEVHLAEGMNDAEIQIHEESVAKNVPEPMVQTSVETELQA